MFSFFFIAADHLSNKVLDLSVQLCNTTHNSTLTTLCCAGWLTNGATLTNTPVVTALIFSHITSLSPRNNNRIIAPGISKSTDLFFFYRWKKHKIDRKPQCRKTWQCVWARNVSQKLVLIFENGDWRDCHHWHTWLYGIITIPWIVSWILWSNLGSTGAVQLAAIVRGDNCYHYNSLVYLPRLGWTHTAAVIIRVYAISPKYHAPILLHVSGNGRCLSYMINREAAYV